MKIKTNLVGGILFSVFSVIILLLVPSQCAASQTPTVGNDPRLMPRVVAIVMLICSLTLIFQSLVMKKETVIEINMADEKNALYASLLMLGFLVCILLFGFLIASFLMIVVFLLFFKEKKILPYIVLCILAIGVYLLFVKLFNVPLTGGVLFK